MLIRTVRPIPDLWLVMGRSMGGYRPLEPSNSSLRFVYWDRLFKWFLDMNILDASFNHSVFSKNKERLLKADVSREFFTVIVDQARGCGLLSDEHFSVDGTLLDAWASMKSFRPKGEDVPPPGDGGRNRAVDFRGERRVNETHESRTDPGARLARRGPGKEALCAMRVTC